MTSQTAHYQRVKQMMQKVRSVTDLSELPEKPQVPKQQMLRAQANLILEEALEVLDACGFTLMPSGELRDGRVLVKNDFILDWKWPEQDIKIDHVAKELADLSVVTTGMFVEFGIADEPVLEAVDANNLAKFGPGSHLDEHRKWNKPPNHPKPDIYSLLVKQGLGAIEVQQREDENTHVSSGTDNKKEKACSTTCGCHRPTG